MLQRPLAAVIAGVLAIGGCAGNVRAQANIFVTDLRDLPDVDLTDSLCDCDSVLPGPQCSLRAALQNANKLGGWVIVTLGATTYTLSYGGTDDTGVAGDLDIFASTLTKLTLQGAVVTVIDGSGLIAAQTPDRILHVTSSVASSCEIEVKDMTLMNGAGVQLGAGVRQDAGRLRLSSVTIAGCAANDKGGGVYTSTADVFEMTGGAVNLCSAVTVGGGLMFDSPASATLSLAGVGVTGCDSGSKGGGIRTGRAAILQAGNCVIDGNHSPSGAGISNRGGLALQDCQIMHNQASGSGGGLANDIGGSLQLDRCVIFQNQALSTGGGLNDSAGATLRDCTFSGNTADYGGGIFNAALAAPLQIQRCTMASNTALGQFGGGGYAGFGDMEMINCTISANQAPAGYGGGILYDGLGVVEINASTIAFNFAGLGGGGIANDPAGPPHSITLKSSILESNSMLGGVSSNFKDVSGILFPLTSAGFNLDSDGTCALTQASDQSGVSAGLGPLNSNGGYTQTHELVLGSPAIDQGSCVAISGGLISEDQRGAIRVAPCDSGAYEYGSLPPPSNDNCGSALPMGPGSLVFSNVSANTDGPAEPPCGFTGQPGQDSDVWFEYVTPCRGVSTISLAGLSGASLDRRIAVYPACPVVGLGPPPLACGVSSGGQPVSVTLQHFSGERYVIRCGAPLGAQGDSNLDITYACACTADIAPPGGNQVVNTDDLIALITTWGACAAPCPPRCLADIAPPPGPGGSTPQGDCAVNTDDLIALITTWGPCP